MKKLYLIIAAFALIIPSSLSAQFISKSRAAESNEVFSKKLANDLAECGGVFQTMSEVLLDLEMPHAAKTYENIARGAWMSSAYLEYMTGEIPNWQNALDKAETDKSNTENFWKGLFELYTPSEEKPFPDGYKNALDYCTGLNPTQDKIVQMMRETIYSQE